MPATAVRQADRLLATADSGAELSVYSLERRLVYQSSRNDELTQAQAREARIVGKLGGEWLHPDMPPPPRPKRMRSRTYARLCDELDTAGAAQDAAFLSGAAVLLAPISWTNKG